MEGQITEQGGVIDSPIGNHPDFGTILMAAGHQVPNAKPAQTEYQVVGKNSAFSLVRAKPVTGRLHQIRVHFASIGHPVLGDEFYAADGELKGARLPLTTNPAISEEEESLITTQTYPNRFMQPGRHALHCCHMKFHHPITGVPLSLSAPCPADLWLSWKENAPPHNRLGFN
ncbi:MAG: pseudouridine synthase [Planctomycetaceae bacterium]